MANKVMSSQEKKIQQDINAHSLRTRMDVIAALDKERTALLSEQPTVQRSELIRDLARRYREVGMPIAAKSLLLEIGE